MKAVEAARHIFSLMEKAGNPYLSPELDDDIPNCPPSIKVTDSETGMMRYIAFADDEAGAEEALRYAQDSIMTLRFPTHYWPEAWWNEGNHWGKLEGWDDEQSD